MQHLQEQLQAAQYGRQQQNQQQNMNQGGGHHQQQLMGFPGIASALTDPQQAAAVQQAQFGGGGGPNQNQNQFQQGFGGGDNGLNNGALAMMQQQQQQQQQMPGMGNNMFNNWNNGGGGQGGGGMQGNQATGMSSAVDASSASSAQLAAFVGMGIGGGGGGQGGNNMGNNVAQNMQGNAAGKNDMMATSNIQAFLQQQQQQQQQPNQQQIPGMGSNNMHGMGLNQQQQAAMMGGQQQGGMGNANAAGGNASAQMLLQQQLAKLQRQFQGQQGNDQQGGGGGMDAASHRGSDAANNLLQGQQQLLQQMRQRGSNPANMQQQLLQQQRQLAQQQQRGSNANLLAQQSSQRGSSASLHQQMSQQGNPGAQQMDQRQSALARLQQMAGPSSAGGDKSNGGGLHRDVSSAQMHGSGSTAQLQRDDMSKSQLQRETSHASVHRAASTIGMQGQGQQGGSNHNWMAPGASQNSQNGMPNQFQNQNSNAMQQRLSQTFGNNAGGGNAFNPNGMSEQELLMQQLQQQRNQQQNQQGGDLLGGLGGGHGGQSSNSGGNNMPQNLQMNFQNLQGGSGGDASVQGMPGMQQLGGAGGASRNNQDANSAAAQKSFLDGNFAGGWQSNADLPDRRHIIFSILEVIKQMRPDTNKISQKLPHMAKSLEEHLYRSAQTKEEYLDLSTLKKRLQMIAHGLELHRSTSSASMPGSEGMTQAQNQQSQQLLRQMANGGNPLVGNNGQQQMRSNSAQGNAMGSDGSIGGGTNQNQDAGGLASSIFPGGDALGGSGASGMPSSGDSSKYQDPIAQQKKKVIRQQQQRLLLLRHASKCGAGPTCKTKFCAQMVTLWKHMKKCRDKNCSTSHCLSSRCVLNHYRICKSQGRTSSCEVCGPVMEQIKRQETGEEAGGADPLTKDQDMPPLDGLVSSNPADENPPQQDSGDQQQLQQLHAAQMKLQNQLQVLKQLQRQQEQLLQQQRHLQEQQSHIKDPHTQQGQQLQQQQALLQQLQQRCQQQQVLLQQELAIQSNAINSAKQKQANQSSVPGEDQQSSSSALGGSLGDSNALVGSNSLGGSLGGSNALVGSNSNSAPTPSMALSENNQKDSSGGSKRGSAVRRQSNKGKGNRGGKGGKGGDTSSRQSEKEASNSNEANPGSKTNDDASTGGAPQQKRRFSLSNTNDGITGPMPEPARKMIKLEPLSPNESEEKDNPSNDAADEPEAGGSAKLKEIGVVIEDNEAKKKLVIDDPFGGDGGPQMSREAIEKQMASIETPTGLSNEEVTNICFPLLEDLIEDPFGWVFRDAVDPVALGLPDYFDVVKKPMHLELVKTNLENKTYEDVESFQKDCSLVFENSILYNGESSEVGQLALTMLSNFATKYEAKMKSLTGSSDTPTATESV